MPSVSYSPCPVMSSTGRTIRVAGIGPQAMTSSSTANGATKPTTTGRAQSAAAHKMSVMIAGLEVRHVHFHLVPIHGLDDLDFKKQQDATPAELDAAAERLVASRMRGLDLLREAGFDGEAAAEADRLLSTAGRDRATLYALAEALARGAARSTELAVRLSIGASRRQLLAQSSGTARGLPRKDSRYGIDRNGCNDQFRSVHGLLQGGDLIHQPELYCSAGMDGIVIHTYQYGGQPRFPQVDGHAHGHEEQPEQEAVERLDVGLELRAVLTKAQLDAARDARDRA